MTSPTRYTHTNDASSIDYTNTHSASSTFNQTIRRDSK